MRRGRPGDWRLLLLVLAVAASAQEAGREPPEPPMKKARLSKASLRYRMRRNYLLPAGVVEAEAPGIRKGRLEKDVTLFFDVDGNGRFNDAGVDGWALSKMAYMMPYEEQTLIGTSNITWRVEADGSFVHFRKEPVSNSLTPEQQRILAHFNTWRMMNGLPSVRIDAELNAACDLHCAYMERNGMEHEEKEGNPGYTPQGAAAGPRSCLSEEAPQMSILMFYSSFFHRLPLLWPGTRAIGIGKSRRYTAIDCLTKRDPRPWRYPIVVPAPNTFAHPTHFARESPNPVPEGVEQPGFPITLTFDTDQVSEAKAVLRRRLKREKYGAPLPILVSAPDNPAVRTRPDNRKSICIIPRQPLRPRATYHVQVKYKLRGAPQEQEWLFSTGKAGPLPRLR